MSVQQAIATQPDNTEGLAFLDAFVREATGNGLVERLITRHGVEGRLTVALP